MISVDPGKLKHALVLWGADGRLLDAAYVDVDALPGWARGPAIVRAQRVAIETQVARAPAQTPGGQAGYQDLIDLAWEAGRFLGRFDPREVMKLRPEQWKGSLPKPKKAADPYLVEVRARGLLSRVEIAIVEKALPTARSKQHNLWDAVGIGLFALGRARRGVTRP